MKNVNFACLGALALMSLSAMAATITGDDNRNVINGTGGSDTIDGRGGNDTIRGRSGNDALLGNDGNDIVTGNAGNDNVMGGDDSDRVDGDSGADTVSGGNGNDDVTGGGGNDTVQGDAGSDTFNYTSRGNDDVIVDFFAGDVLNLTEANTNQIAFAFGNSIEAGDPGVTNDSGNLVIDFRAVPGVFGGSGDLTLRGLGGNSLRVGSDVI